MIRRLSTCVLTIAAMMLVANAVCQAQSLPLLTHHVREVTLNGQAQLVGRLPATQSMRIDIVLALRDPAGLENFLQDVYDPSSLNYRHFLTVQDFTNMFGPSQENYDAVIRFAKANGFTVAGGSREAMDMQLTGSVATIQTAFHVTLGVYQHPTENRTFYAPDREPTVNLPFQLWHISGLDNYSIPRPLMKQRPLGEQPLATTGSCPQQSFCGSDMRAAYYSSQGGTLTGSGQNIGLLEFLGYDIADVNTYYTNAGQTRTAAVTGISTDGTSINCVYPSCDDTEQTLDITQALGMAPGVTTLYMYVGSSDTALLGCMSSSTPPCPPLMPNLSSSWYWSGPDQSTDDPYFEKMAAQGQSFFEATGDSGRWLSKNTWWPMESDYVIGVGGTDLVTTGPGGAWNSETAWADGGGGISPDNIPIPSWQTLAASGCPNCSQSYRNGPDVSANSNFTFYVCADQSGCTANEYGGTSFAAPMWAGYMALVNEQAVAYGEPTLGFINPSVYTIGLGSSYNIAFHDITSGSNGWPATPGYDLATGWGSPNGPGLLNALTATSPTPGYSVTATPRSQTVVQGGSTSYTATVTPANSFTGSVTMSVSGLPTGASGSFSPNPVVITSGAQDSTLSVNTGSAAAGTYTVEISGADGALNSLTLVTLVISPGPGGSLSPTSLNFGNVVVNTTSKTMTTTLTSNGGSALNISSINITGTSAGDFAQTNNCPATLNKGATCKINVTFTPSIVGGESATLNVIDNASNSPQTATLSGTGIAAATLTPASGNFGNVAEGTPSAAKNFTLTNNQSVALNISSITTGNPDYTQTNTCDGSLAAHGHCTISVTFTPSIIGTETGTLTVTDGASNSPQTASLTGTGAVPATLTPTSANFGNVPQGTPSSAKNFTLTNNAVVALSISSITASNPDYTQTNTCGSSVAAKGHCTISVTFTPSNIGTETGTLTVTDGALNSPQTASLTGAGIAQATVTPTTITFAAQKVGTTSGAHNVTLKNNLSTALTFSVTFSGADPGDFASPSNSCGGSVPAKSTCTIGVTFTPTATGTRTATLDVNDSANNSPQTVSLTGTGK